MAKTLHALPRKGCFTVFMILGQVFVMEWKSQLGTVTRMKSHLSCLYLKEGNLLRYTQICEKRFSGNFSSICILEISEFSVEWFALRNSSISGFSGTFPGKFPYHLSFWVYHLSFWLNGKRPHESDFSRLEMFEALPKFRTSRGFCTLYFRCTCMMHNFLWNVVFLLKCKYDSVKESGRKNWILLPFSNLKSGVE